MNAKTKYWEAVAKARGADSEEYCRKWNAALEKIANLETKLSAAEFGERFYSTRCEALQDIQSRMRDPERQMVCDILANGKPRDKAGIGQYTQPSEEG